MDEERHHPSPPRRRRRDRKRKRLRNDTAGEDAGGAPKVSAVVAAAEATDGDSDVVIPATVRALLGGSAATLAEYARGLAPGIVLPRRLLVPPTGPLDVGRGDDGISTRPINDGDEDDGPPSKATFGGSVGSETGADDDNDEGGNIPRERGGDAADDDDRDDLYDQMRRIIVAPYRTPRPPSATISAAPAPATAPEPAPAAAPVPEPSPAPAWNEYPGVSGSSPESTAVVPIPSFGLGVADRATAAATATVAARENNRHRRRHRRRHRPSPCSEPLDALVDSVVSSLVHEPRRGDRRTNGSNGDGSPRRHRGGFRFFRGGWGRNDNVLSLGYRLASDARRSMRDGDVRSYCPNMAPGVVCVRPNSSVTYLKTSPLMREVHSILGDDAMRSMLLNAVVLVPCGPGENGNFFQLCGPPLSRLARGEVLGGSSMLDCEVGSTSLGREARSRSPDVTPKKRSDGSVAIETAEAEASATTANDSGAVANSPRTLEEPWDANRPLPRHRIFYSQSFVKKVGLPPSHILNDGDAAEAEFPSKLLDSLVHLRMHEPGGGGASSANHGRNNAGKKKARLRRKRWTRLRESGIDMCRRLRLRHRRCDYARALERHCPLPELVRKNKGKDSRGKAGVSPRGDGSSGASTDDTIDAAPAAEDTRAPKTTGAVAVAAGSDDARHEKGGEEEDSPPSLPDLVAAHTPAEDVASFLGVVLGQAFPRDFWGSPGNDGRNFGVACDAVRRFILLRRHEQLPEKAIVAGIRVNDVEWLAGGGGGGGGGDGDGGGDGEDDGDGDGDGDGDDDRSEAAPGAKRRRGGRKRSASDHAASTRLVRHVMRWVFCRFVIPLLRSTFYVTEGEFAGKRTLYYRKPVWSALRSRAMRYLVEETGHYRELGGEELDGLALARPRLGPSRLRLLPKKSGIRPIASMSRRGFSSLGGGGDTVQRGTSTNAFTSSKCNEGGPTSPTLGSTVLQELLRDRFLSTNMTLRPTFAVLKYEQSRAPERLGSGIFGLDQVYPLYSKFLKDLEKKGFRIRSVDAGAPVDDRLRSSTATGIDSPRPLYFASADIHRCYDNINQHHLVELVRGLLSEDDYLIEKLTVLHPYKSKGWVERKAIRSVLPPECMKQFHDVAGDLARRYTNSVFVDDVNCSVTRREEIIELLKEHIFGHIVVAHGSLGPRFLVQSKGIPQGSILGTILCNFYYGDVESELLRDVFRCDETEHVHFLVRIVDDFLLISSDQTVARRFLHTIHEGIPHLGVQINKAKTLANFDFHIENNDGDVERVEKTGELFPWCGLSFDTRTCEVSVDYSRFSGSKAADTLTVANKGKEGEALRIRMKAFVRPRCQAILFDNFINRESVIASNFYQAMLFCAIKTVHYASNLEGGAQSNISYFVECVEDVIAYSHNLIRGRLRCMRAKQMASDGENSDGGCIVQHGWTCLTKVHAQWLGRHAFMSVLRYRKGDYQGVITELQSCLSVVSYCAGSLERVAKLALQDFSIDSFINN